METRIRAVRKDLHIRLRPLAAAMAISPSALSSKERGLTEVTMSELERCAAALTRLSGYYVPLEALYHSSLLHSALVCTCDVPEGQPMLKEHNR